MPTNSAVREMLPPKRLICATRYSRSNTSRASRSGKPHQVLAAIAARQARHQRADVRRQHVRGHRRIRVARGEDQEPLDVVAQLAHIARPVVRLQHGKRIVGDATAGEARGLRDVLEEELDQFRHVLAPLGERGHADRHHAEPVVEVLAEAPSAISFSRLRAVEEMMRTSTDTRVDPPTRRKFWSTSTRNMRFCVSRGMSAISSMNSVPPCASSSAPTCLPCPSVALDAEQLDLHPLRRDGRGVDHHERPVGARRGGVDHAGGRAPCRSRRGRRS